MLGALGPFPRSGASPARPAVVLERLATGPFLRVAARPGLDVGRAGTSSPADRTAGTCQHRMATGRSPDCDDGGAPRLQPDVTEHDDDAEAQARRMGTDAGSTPRGSAERRRAEPRRPARSRTRGARWAGSSATATASPSSGRVKSSATPGTGGLMVRVTQLADDGTETAAIEVDDFTIEVIYSGLAEMLREAAAAPPRRLGAVLRALPGGAPAPPAGPQPPARLTAGREAGTRLAPNRSEQGSGPGAKGRAATLKRHAHLPGGHPRCPPGPRRG